MNTLGVILARGGSRRIPRKNLRELRGTPLIVWTIRSAQCAELLEKVVVSSDDTEILNLARSNGVAVVNRPEGMATDEAGSYRPLLHAMDAQDDTYTHVCLLQPTSPFRHPGDIDACILICRDQAACVSYEIGEDAPNGAIYVARVDWLRDAVARGDEFPFDGPTPMVYRMPEERSLDLDEEEDWDMAEAMLAGRLG